MASILMVMVKSIARLASLYAGNVDAPGASDLHGGRGNSEEFAQKKKRA